MSALSIIVPVRGEISGFKAFLLRLLETVAPLNGSEIIVVDGTGGRDISAICRSLGVCVIRTAGGRLLQMSRGAAQAHGDYLLFVSPDITLSANFSDVWRNIRRRGPIWGFFSLRFNRAPWRLRCLAQIISLRSRFFGIAVADQPLFVQRNAWQLAGESDTADGEPQGYVGLCRRLGLITTPWVVRQSVESQSASWQKAGLRSILCAGLSARLHMEVDEALQINDALPPGKLSSGRKRAPELP